MDVMERCDGLDDAKPASETEDLIEKGVPWATHLYIYFRERRRAASLHLTRGVYQISAGSVKECRMGRNVVPGALTRR